MDDLFSPPLLESLFVPLPAKRQVSINQDFMDLSLTSTSLWKRLVAKLKVSRASPVRTTSWLLQRGAVLDFVEKSQTRLSS